MTDAWHGSGSIVDWVAGTDSSADDLFDWFFTSPDFRRARNLQRQVESNFEAQSVAAERRAELSRQLERVQGDLGAQVAQLSRRFDAFVELEGLRQRLQAHPGTAAAREAAVGALELLLRGERPRPLETGDGVYALPFAMNAIIAAAFGDRDAAAEQRATALDPDSALLLVAALGGLRRGETVAGLVPDLLINDHALTPAQVTLWNACRAGLFPGVWPQLERVVQPAVTRVDWLSWVQEQGPAPLDLIAGMVDSAAAAPAEAPPRLVEWRPTPPGETNPEPTPEQAALIALRSLAGRLVVRGRRDEQPLIQRMDELQRIVDDPAAVDRRDGGDNAAAVTIVDLVRAALRDPGLPAEQRKALLHWCAGPLDAVVERLGATARPAPGSRKVQTYPGDAVVTADGPLPDVSGAYGTDLAAAQRARSLGIAAAAGGAVLGIGAAVAAGVTHAWLWWLAAVVGVAVAVVGARQAWSATHDLTSVGLARDDVRAQLEKAQAAVAAEDAAAVQRWEQGRADADRLRRRLADLRAGG